MVHRGRDEHVLQCAGRAREQWAGRRRGPPLRQSTHEHQDYDDVQPAAERRSWFDTGPLFNVEGLLMMLLLLLLLQCLPLLVGYRSLG